MRQDAVFSDNGLSQVDVLKHIHLIAHNKTLDLSKLKGFAVNNLNEAQMVEIVMNRIENNEGKGENASYQHFLLFSQCPQKVTSLGLIKPSPFWQRGDFNAFLNKQ